ncbi:odorant receptor 46a-like [Neocloeon triangulifer]|uniref:odorant receptor 46a-like n=1 Tax=Neocloeon triangulifer TaxID=2078957 RepID=UPI00286F4CAB|nr:odorant receptor 46a-like [Neocloeon triangulifer]
MGTLEESVVGIFTKHSLMLLKITGLWPMGRKHRRASAYLFRISILHFCLALAAQVLSLIFDEEKSFESVVPTVLQTLMVISMILKSIFIVNNRTEIRALHFFWDDEKGVRLAITRALPEIRKVYFAYALSLIASGSFWLTEPKVTDQKLVDAHPERSKLPLNGWYPFDLDSDLNFRLVYVHQLFSVMLIGTVSHGCNLLFLTFIIFVSNLLAFFIEKLEKVPQTENIEESVKDCAQLKIKIDRFTRDVGRIFSKVAFVQFAQSTMTFVISSFRATAPGLSLKEKVLYMQGFYTQFIYLYLICRYGGEIIHKSYEILKKIYFWPWEDWKQEEIDMMLMMSNANQKPLKLTAGLYTLSLEFFLRACGLAITGYLLLQNIRNSKI